MDINIKLRIHRYLKKCGETLFAFYGLSGNYTFDQILKACDDTRIPQAYRSFMFAIFGTEDSYCRVSGFDFIEARTNILTKILGYERNRVPRALDFDQLFDVSKSRQGRYEDDMWDTNQRMGMFG